MLMSFYPHILRLACAACVFLLDCLPLENYIAETVCLWCYWWCSGSNLARAAVCTTLLVETGPENGLFWLRRLDRYSTISTILNFQCETAREVPLRGMRSMLNLDTFSWQESPCKLYIYIYIYIYIFLPNNGSVSITFVDSNPGRYIKWLYILGCFTIF